METWKPVIGYEGIYEVSDTGRVKRIAGWSDGRKTKPVGILRINPNKRYARVILHNKLIGDPKYLLVHRIVMAAFVGPLPSGMEVNHKNGKKHDNRLENLEYMTHPDNQLHAHRVLKIHHFKGSESGTAKVNESQVALMRELRRQGWMLKDLAVKFGLSISTICWICKNKAWRHVSG